MPALSTLQGNSGMLYLLVGLGQFCLVAAKAFQQLNVMHHKRLWVFWTSLMLAVFEILLTGTVAFKAVQSVDTGEFMPVLLLVIPLWVGGSAGSLLSMSIHKKLR